VIDTRVVGASTFITLYVTSQDDFNWKAYSYEVPHIQDFSEGDSFRIGFKVNGIVQTVEIITDSNTFYLSELLRSN
jgi:hypothetical protein